MLAFIGVLWSSGLFHSNNICFYNTFYSFYDWVINYLLPKHILLHVNGSIKDTSPFEPSCGNDTRCEQEIYRVFSELRRFLRWQDHLHVLIGILQPIINPACVYSIPGPSLGPMYIPIGGFCRKNMASTAVTTKVMDKCRKSSNESVGKIINKSTLQQQMLQCW